MKRKEKFIKRILSLSIVVSLFMTSNALAITEYHDWRPGGKVKKTVQPTNSQDNNGINAWYYFGRSSDIFEDWKDPKNGHGVFLHGAFNTKSSVQPLYAAGYGGGSQHPGMAIMFAEEDRDEHRNYLGYFEKKDNILKMSGDVSASVNATLGITSISCGGTAPCTDGSGDSCSASINVSISCDPINSYISSGVLLKSYIIDNGHTETSSEDYWTDSDVQEIVPDQKGSVDLDLIYYQKDISLSGKKFGPTTTTIDPITCWNSSRLYGSDNKDLSMSRGNNLQEVKNNVSLCTDHFEYGNYIWPVVKTKYVDYSDPKWKDAYLVGPPSRIPNPLILYMATNVGDVKSSDPNKKVDYTLKIDSQWDGWTKTITGLKDTGILDANGDDRNCVVEGGSTVFIHGSDTSDASKLRFMVNGFIPLYNYREKPQDDRDVWCYCGCDDDSGLAGGGLSMQAQQYPFDETYAYHCANILKDQIEKNLGHMRLQLMAAEGIYRQGEEDLFEKNAVCVKGAGAGDGEYDEEIRQEKNKEKTEDGKLKSAQGHFGSFDGTAGSGKGNILDGYDKNGNQLTSNYHDKYHFNSKYGDVSENNDSIKIKRIESSDYNHVYAAWVDVTQDNKAKLNLYDYDVNDTGTFASWDNAVLRRKNSYTTSIDIRSKLKDNNAGRGQTYQEVYESLLSCLSGKWRQAERLTGWLSAHIAALDYGHGGSELRPSDSSVYDSGSHGQTAGWYNEGFTDIGLFEFQYEYEIDFDDVTKWIVIDPALCGQSIDHYDLKNWSDNDNDGVKDTDLTKPGALKDKIRTLRFQLSDFIRYEDDEEYVTGNGLSYYTPSASGQNAANNMNNIMQKIKNGEIDSSSSDPVIKNIYKIFKNGVGEENYLGTFTMMDMDIQNGYGGVNIYDSSSAPHWLSVPIYLNFSTAMKSKFFYLTNATVEDNNR